MKKISANSKRSHRFILKFSFLTLLSIGASSAFAFDGVVKKQVFTLPSYTALNGQTIKNVRIGYETYGTLNAAKDNVIVISHHITGTSHAAGKYAAEDATPGYWDSIIGAGKPIDTDKFFVVSADTLANPNAKLPTVVTTGPSSIDAESGKPYGMRFPVVAARDFVDVHKKLLDSLGIKKIYAVAGASAGAAQSVEWASAYPELVERLISVVGPGIGNNAYTIGLMKLWAMPVLLDPKWNRGDYYGREEPVEGLSKAMTFVTYSALSYGWGEKLFKTKWAAADKDPGQAFDNLYAVEDVLNKAGSGRFKATDANNWLYTTKAYQLSSVEAPRIKARSLFIAVDSDNIFPPFLSKRAVDTLRAQGGTADYLELPSEGGHFDGIARIDQAGKAIAEFLAK